MDSKLAAAIIDICDQEYDDARQFLLQQAVATVDYILNNFIQKSNVFVAGDTMEFIQILQSYVLDPCTSG